jgi:hypothetical protein
MYPLWALVIAMGLRSGDLRALKTEESARVIGLPQKGSMRCAGNGDNRQNDA